MPNEISTCPRAIKYCTHIPRKRIKSLPCNKANTNTSTYGEIETPFVFQNRIRRLKGDELQFIFPCYCTDVVSVFVVETIPTPTILQPLCRSIAS